jgi:hypothetical protein
MRRHWGHIKVLRIHAGLGPVAHAPGRLTISAAFATVMLVIPRIANPRACSHPRPRVPAWRVDGDPRCACARPSGGHHPAPLD